MTPIFPFGTKTKFALFTLILCLFLLPNPAFAKKRLTHHKAVAHHYALVDSSATYADIVIDAETGHILHATSPDSLRHPASLTKMMTLYLTFQALESGKLQLNQYLPISENASEQSPSKLGLRPGQRIRVEDAILGLVTESANDAAVVLGEWLGGSESGFAELMTRQAHALGMAHTHFQNPSGLPDPDQVTTARDMAVLGHSLITHFPQFYPYFSTESFTYAGLYHHNHNHLMDRYDGMDGIKTGYIRASGFNLVASAKRGSTRLIGVVFGGKSAVMRDNQMAQLLDQCFAIAGKDKSLPPAKPLQIEDEASNEAQSPNNVLANSLTGNATQPATEAEAEDGGPATGIQLPAPGAAATQSGIVQAKPNQIMLVTPKVKPAQLLLVKPTPTTQVAQAVAPAPAKPPVPPATASPTPAATAPVATAPMATAAPQPLTPAPTQPAPPQAPAAQSAPLPPAPKPAKTAAVTKPLPPKKVAAKEPVPTPTPSATQILVPPPGAVPVNEIAQGDASGEGNPHEDVTLPAKVATVFPPATPPSVMDATKPNPAATPQARQDAISQMGMNGGGVWGIQIGAFSDINIGKQALATLVTSMPQLLGTGQQEVQKVSSAGVTVYRARLMQLDQRTAQTVCNYLIQHNQSCTTIGP